MTDELYPSRREFLGIAGLAIAESAVPAPLAAMAQLTESRYAVKFQVLNDDDLALENQLGVPYLEPRGVPIKATAEEIREAYIRWRDGGRIPNLDLLDTTLEDIANQLKNNKDLLHSTFELKEVQQMQRGEEILYKMGYERKLPDTSVPLLIEFAGILRKELSIEPVLLMGYNIARIDQKATYQRRGDLTSEVVYLEPHKGGYREFRVVPKNDENELSTPLDKLTIPRVDATGSETPRTYVRSLFSIGNCMMPLRHITFEDSHNINFSRLAVG